MGSALHRNITEKGKPFLEKYGIPYDLSNYQNDGYLKAGDKGYNFWYDHDNEDFETDAPSYKGKGFADLKELLAYALDVADAKEEYRKAWGDDIYKKRSASNFDVEEDTNNEVGEEVKENIDTNNNGKVEKSEMENFTDSLNDYMDKNKKGRDDIPVTTRR
jgi:hypothetical protein